LKPIEAVDLLQGTVQNDPRIKVVGIAGPGDALANQETFETIKQINGQLKQNRPQICISTLM
jgi:nitrogen fixation protein NifB